MRLKCIAQRVFLVQLDNQFIEHIIMTESRRRQITDSQYDNLPESVSEILN